MSLITSTTNNGLSIRQQAINAAPLGAAAAAAAIPPAKKYAVEEQSLSTILNSAIGLRANISNISSINVKDQGVLSLTLLQYKDNASLISKLSGNRKFQVTGATMAEMSTIVKNKNVASITVSDTAANIQAGMGTLISNNGKFNAGSITKTDSTTDITISGANYKQANAANGVLSKFAAGSFASANLNVTGASASDFASILADSTKVKNVAIADSVANIFKNADTITAAITASAAKVGTVTATGAKTPSMTMAASAYTTYTGTTHLALIGKINTGNANALTGAFALTGATIGNIMANSNAFVTDANIKSIAVSDLATVVTGASAPVLAKVTKADVTTTADVLKATNASLVTSLANLGSKLSSVTLTAGNSLDGLDVANIKDKSKALVLAKTKGVNGDPIGLEIVNAKLADVNGLLANKQVNTAKIADTAKKMLAFSAFKFTMLANAKTVSFALTDNAVNIGKYSTMLQYAVEKFTKDRISLDVKDTAANLTTNLEKLDKLATLITGADEDGQSKYDNSRIKIQQSTASGDAEITNLIKVAFINYSDRRDVLQYIKDSTAGMLQEHVEIDTAAHDSVTVGTESKYSLQRAKDISNTLQLQKFMANPTLVAPKPGDNKVMLASGDVVTGEFGFRKEAAGSFLPIANDGKTYGFSADDGTTWTASATGKKANQLYSDIAQININLEGDKASQDSVEVLKDKDLLTPTTSNPGYLLKAGLKPSLTLTLYA